MAAEPTYFCVERYHRDRTFVHDVRAIFYTKKEAQELQQLLNSYIEHFQGDQRCGCNEHPEYCTFRVVKKGCFYFPFCACIGVYYNGSIFNTVSSWRSYISTAEGMSRGCHLFEDGKLWGDPHPHHLEIVRGLFGKDSRFKPGWLDIAGKELVTNMKP
jgi:hypothetical protein